MKFFKIKSYAKLNLSLYVIKKIPKKLHTIESLVTFINFYDLIYVREIKALKHKIKFFGKFSKNISKNNTINKLLNLLDRKELLNTEALVLGPSRFCESGMGLFMDAGSRSKHSVQTVMVTEHLVGPQGCDLYPAGRLTACRVRLVYEHP